MMTKTTTVPKNVYELAQERLRIVFNEFDNVFPFREEKIAECC